MGRPKKGVTPEDRFWGRVLKRTSKGCWLWLGYSHNGRYGSLQWKGRRLGAHVFGFMLSRKMDHPPACGYVLHHCDQPLCVRGDHLYLGTQRDNARDSLRRGTFGRSKLTLAQARWSRGKDYRKIMQKFDVSESHARSLSVGRYWKGVL